MWLQNLAWPLSINPNKTTFYIRKKKKSELEKKIDWQILCQISNCIKTKYLILGASQSDQEGLLESKLVCDPNENRKG